MTEPKILLFLHGVRDKNDRADVAESRWREPLFTALKEAGYENLDEFQVIAPNYPDLLRDVEEKVKVPPVITKKAANDNRRRYEERISALEVKLGHSHLGRGKFYQETLVKGVVNFDPLNQAKQYIEDKQTRGALLSGILGLLPESGRIVIVGHSLGSVVAADLLSRLPEGLHVDGMVTIGSPLGSQYFATTDLKKELKEPPANLEWWVNFWATGDPVTATRGLSASVPWVLDLAVDTGINPLKAHLSASFVSNPVVAKTIGYALLGSTSKDLVMSESSLDVPINDQERLAILGLRFIFLLEQELSTSKKAKDSYVRLSKVRKIVQSQIMGGLIEDRKKHQEPIPTELIRMSMDLGEGFEMGTPTADEIRNLFNHDPVKVLPGLFASNPIAPYEIEIGNDIRKQAAKKLTKELGLTSKYAEEVLDALEKAEKALDERKLGRVWILGAAAVGVTAVVAAPIGLGLTLAAPGLYGGAAVASALAAFGPGGMIGGLYSAGALLTAGSSTLAFSLSNLGKSAEEIEEMLILPLAEAQLSVTRNLQPDPSIWFDIVEAEIQLQRQHEHLRAFNDSKSALLSELERKLKALGKAIAFLRELGLDPGFEDTETAQNGNSSSQLRELFKGFKSQ